MDAGLRCAPRRRDGRPRLRRVGRRPAAWCPTRPRWRRWPPSTSRCPTLGADAVATLAPAARRRQPGDRRVDRRAATSASSTAPLSRSRSARRGWSSAWDQNAALPVMSPVAAKLHDVVARLARRPAAACRPARASRSSPARRSPTPRASPPPATRCSAALGWDAQADGLFGAPDAPGGRSASAPTRRCRSRSASSASAATGSRSCPPTTRAGCGPTCCPTSTGRCWCARRPAR